MIGPFNHCGIAVLDLEQAVSTYRDTLGAKVSEPQDVQEHGVTVAFVEFPDTKVELLHPLGEKPPIQGFLDENPSGGVHHVCYEVDDIYAARGRVEEQGARFFGSGDPKIGAHGNPVLFLHPKDFYGALVEPEEAK